MRVGDRTSSLRLNEVERVEVMRMFWREGMLLVDDLEDPDLGPTGDCDDLIEVTM